MKVTVIPSSCLSRIYKCPYCGSLASQYDNTLISHNVHGILDDSPCDVFTTIDQNPGYLMMKCNDCEFSAVIDLDSLEFRPITRMIPGKFIGLRRRRRYDVYNYSTERLERFRGNDLGSLDPSDWNFSISVNSDKLDNRNPFHLNPFALEVLDRNGNEIVLLFK